MATAPRNDIMINNIDHLWSARCSPKGFLVGMLMKRESTLLECFEAMPSASVSNSIFLYQKKIHELVEINYLLRLSRKQMRLSTGHCTLQNIHLYKIRKGNYLMYRACQ